MKLTRPAIFTFAACLLFGTLSADTIVRDNKGERETLEGTIIQEEWDRIKFRQAGGGTISINVDDVYTCTRDISGLLAKARGEAVAASTSAAVAAADGQLKQASQNARKPWEREYAAWFRVQLWVANGDVNKAIEAAKEVEKQNPKSRFLAEAWIDIAGLAHGANDAAKIKQAGTKLKPLGSLGRAAGSYFDALALLAKNDLKAGGDKMRLSFRQLAAQKSVAGRRLWISAAWRYGQVLVDQKSTAAAKEHLEALQKDYATYDERGKGVTHCLEGDVLRLQGKDADALYAYMRVVVQYPQYPDAHAHALDWGAALATKLKYDKDAKKLTDELSSRYRNYKRKATN